MIAAIQDVPVSLPASVAGTLALRGRLTPEAGAVESTSATPSVIVSLGAERVVALTYNAAGQIDPQAQATATPPDVADATFRALVAADTAATVAVATADLAVIPTTARISAIDVLAPSATPTPSTDFTALATSFLPGAPGTTDVAVPEPRLAVIPSADFTDTAPTFIPGAPGTTDVAVAEPEVAAPPTADFTDTAASFIPGAAGTSDIDVPAPAVAAAPPAGAADTVTAAETGTTTAPPVPIVVPLADAIEPDTAAIDLPSAPTAAAIVPPPPGVPTATVAADEAEPTVTPAAPDTTADATPDLALAALLTVPNTAAPAATPATPGAAAVTAPATPTLVDAATQAHRNIAGNPFYAGLAATMYVNALIFRLQQSSAAELPHPNDSAQPVGGIRAVAAVSFDRNGPADEEREGASLERRTIASGIYRRAGPGAIEG